MSRDPFLRAGLTRVLVPGDAGYDDAVAGFDLSVETAPEVVIDAQTPAEVATAVAVAAGLGTPVTILGTGHGRLHAIDGGVAVTVRALDSIEIDVAARTARIGAGSRWASVVSAAAEHGLAAPCGSSTSVGVVGYLLGGGLGPLASSVGVSSDHVRSFEVVTAADGPITVSPESHADLFWAMRGGKTGFGVVTAVTVELLPVAEVVGGGIYFDGADAAAVLAAYAQWSMTLPETSTTSIALLRLPPAPALPAAIRGRRVAHLRFASLDAPAGAQSQLRAVRAVPSRCSTRSACCRTRGSAPSTADPSAPMPVANGTASLAELTAETVDALLGAAGLDTDLPLSAVELRTLGPGVRRPAAGADAVGGRDTAHLLNVYAAPDPSLADEIRLAAIRTALGATADWQLPATLINFVGRGNTDDEVARAWSSEQRSRLDAIRLAHDPDGLFAARADR